MAAANKQRRAPVSSLAAIVSHPVRAKCWTILTERAASPNELKDIVKRPLGDVAYHVKVLREMGVVDLVKTEPRRGAVEHWYRAVERPHINDEETASLSPEERSEFARYICLRAFADAAIALEQRTFCARSDFYVTRIPLVLDEEGWKEMNTAYADVVERIMEVQAASAGRLSQEPEARQIQTTAIAMFFEMPDPAESLSVESGD